MFISGMCRDNLLIMAKYKFHADMCKVLWGSYRSLEFAPCRSSFIISSQLVVIDELSSIMNAIARLSFEKPGPPARLTPTSLTTNCLRWCWTKWHWWGVIRRLSLAPVNETASKQRCLLFVFYEESFFAYPIPIPCYFFSTY